MVRDEEMGLPSNKITFEEYRDQLNAKLVVGDLVWSNWLTEEIRSRKYSQRESRGRYRYLTAWDEEVIYRPKVCKIVSIKKKTQMVRITWGADYYVWGHYDRWDGWVASENKVRNRYLWIPMKEVFNVSGYTLGDYKMFLCDRSLRGEYLKWARQILTSEDMARERKKEDETL